MLLKSVWLSTLKQIAEPKGTKEHSEVHMEDGLEI